MPIQQKICIVPALGKTKLLEQKIPATYLALEDLIGVLSAELRGQGHDPVLNRDQGWVF